MRGFFNSALAMATLCLCPPDSCIPLSSTRVLSPSGKRSMDSQALACLAASVSCSSVAFGPVEKDPAAGGFIETQ
jgi:hypothetical protein